MRSPRRIEIRSDRMAKSESAFRTIGELSVDTGIPQHVLRYWESRFPQLRPLQRAGKRRYYRPEDVALVRRIQHLLGPEGYTVKGVQKLLAEKGGGIARATLPMACPPPRAERTPLLAVRDRLAAALDADSVAAI